VRLGAWPFFGHLGRDQLSAGEPAGGRGGPRLLTLTNDQFWASILP
jgi:hypothetical protein